MLKELKEHHREVARLSFQGYKPSEIASRTGSKVGTIYAILRDAMCKSFISGLSDQANKSVINVREKLASMSLNSLSTINHMIKKENRETTPAAVRLAAARDILDRNGYKATEKHEHLHGHFTAKDLAELKGRAAEVTTEYLS